MINIKQQRTALYEFLKSGFGETMATNMCLSILNTIEKARAVLTFK